MAARRLLIIMLVLLGISSAIAIAVPKPERDDAQSTGTTGETGSKSGSEEASDGTTGASGTEGADGTTGSGKTAGTGAKAVADEGEGASKTDQTGTTGNQGTTGEVGPAGSGETTAETGANLTERSVSLDRKQPVRFNLKVGSRLVLTVNSKAGSEVEIEGLGLTGFADPFAPAYFDVILPAEPGAFRVSAPGAKPVAVISTR